VTVAQRRPHVTVVGLGPAGGELLGEAATTLLADPGHTFLRTARHPAAAPFIGAHTFDRLYESGADFDEVYAAIVEELIEAARRVVPEPVVYAVPGSPLVAERTVELLRADDRVDVTVVPGLSFLDLAWDRLRIDPLTSGVRLVDAAAFSEAVKRERGPFLVGQCWTVQLLSDVKLSVPDGAGWTPPHPVILHHLGLEDEVVAEVDWWELDRTVEPDHLTSLYVPAFSQPMSSETLERGIGGDVARLVELMETLRARCPWDGAQTHATLMPYLVEECHEVLDALAALPDGGEEAYGHLEEELGDLLFQIVFHARLASENEAFDLGGVARGIHDKLVNRHPHVFGEVEADTTEQVLSNWETIKKDEKERSSVTEGVPTSLPALMLANKLARKARSVGLEPVPHGADAPQDLVGSLAVRAAPAELHPDDPLSHDAEEQWRLVGEVLFVVADLAQRLGVDAEQALRARALALREAIVAAESVPEQERGNR
jgi:tetrapyrrole methylase family protein/MazG family protein